MKKCILVIDWLKWNTLKEKRTEVVKQHCVQAYADHMENLFDYDEVLEQYLKEKDIDYYISIYDYKFQKYSKKKA